MKNDEFLNNVKKMNRESLIKELKTAKKELSKYNLIRSVGKENNSNKFKILKKRIAQLNTILVEVIHGQ